MKRKWWEFLPRWWLRNVMFKRWFYPLWGPLDLRINAWRHGRGGVMDEMVERVARAIAPDAWRGGILGAFLRKRSLKQARAAIAAMREPTEEMKRAYWDLIPDNEDGPHPGVAWRSMIDAALGPARKEAEAHV